MSGKYDAVAVRSLATIKRKGAPVLFPGADPVAGPPVYDPITDTWSGGGTGAATEDVTGQAVQIPGDPERFSALGLVLVDPVTLMVAAKGLGITPASGMPFTWPAEDGTTYDCKDAEAVAPDGVPIIWVITGSA